MKTFTALSIVALTLVGIAKAVDDKPEAKPAADASPSAIAAADVAKAKKVTAAEFAKEYAWVGKAQDMHGVSYLGQQDGKAFIRKRSMLGASSLSGKWSERIIYVQLEDLTPELRAELEKAAALPKASAPTSLMVDGDYSLKISHLVENDATTGKDQEIPIPEGTFKAVNSLKSVEFRVSEKGEKVTVLAGDKAAGNTYPREDVPCRLIVKSDDERVYRSIKPGEGNNLQLTLKQTKQGMIGTLTEFGSGKPVLAAFRGAVTERKSTQTKREKTSAKALFDPIVKNFLSAVKPDYNKDGGYWNNADFIKKGSEFVVSEFEIDGLWDTLGAQIFQLDCSPHEWSEVFIYANGSLQYQPLMDGRGLADAVVTEGFLYFTHRSGSGIGQKSLVKVSRSEGNVLQTESLGSIESRPEGYEDKELVKRMADVIAKLRPVKRGATQGSAPTADTTKPQPVDLNSIKNKVSVKFGKDTVAKLQREGDRLVPRPPDSKDEANDVAVKLSIQETTETPFPVEGDPTRSYLSMSNGSDKWLRFRALARLKGSKDFYEVPEPLDPVEPGEMTLIKCWLSGTLVEEVILFDLALTQKPANQ